MLLNKYLKTIPVAEKQREFFVILKSPKTESTICRDYATM